MDKSSSSRVPRSHVQEKFTMSLRKREGLDGPKEKVMKLEGQADRNQEKGDQITTMIIGATTATGQFVQLPPELLLIVIEKLKESELLSCRQINKTWRVLTSPKLRPLISCEFYSDSEVKKFNRCLEMSKNLFFSLDSFPCCQFRCHNMSLSGCHLQNFFNLYGTSIQSLDFKLETKLQCGQLRALSRLLIHQAPNIKHLTLNYRNSYWNGRSGILFDDQQTKLPHLETLSESGFRSEQDKNIMEELISAAPNLKTYTTSQSLQGHFPLDMLMSKDKIHTLKAIKMSMKLKHIELCEKFADTKPKLKLLACSSFDAEEFKNNPGFLKRAVAVTSKILEYSKDTLTHLDEFYPLGYLPGIIYPVLSRLERLVLLDTHGFDTSKEIFPPGLSLSKKFPVVRDLVLNLGGPAESANFWDTIFPFNLVYENYWPSVATVTIDHRFQNCIPNLSLLLPNLKKLIVSGSQVNFPLFCRGIFGHMKQLDTIKFIAVDVSRPANTFPAIDSVISGFSPQTCRRLAEFDDTLDVGQVEELRENLSILELTGLRTLKIIFARGRDEPILSRASEIFTFPQMPQLTVTTVPYRAPVPAPRMSAS